jgi:kinesin family protein 4/21/27
LANNKGKEYTYDKVLGPACSQQQVFDMCNISELIDKVVEGYHATVFAYGQTGAGKTFTMEGYDYSAARENSAPKPIIEKSERCGVIPRSISYLFDKIANEANITKRKYNVYCSFLQIYNEKIFDLLNPSHFTEDSIGAGGLKLRFKNNNFAVDNLYTFECKTKKDVYDLFHFGLNNRIVAAHRLNHASSRSHSLLTITVESIDQQNPVHLSYL